MELKLVKVVWVDAMSVIDPIPLEEIMKFVPIERSNVGYLLCSDNEKVIIAGGIMHNLYKGEFAHDYSMLIPKCMVIRIEYLNEVKE